MTRPLLITQELIKSRVAVNENGCWNWTGSRNKTINRPLLNNKYAYRCSYEVFVGAIPDGLQINHHCDNPMCVNPDHIYAGTQAQNHQDALDRGRNLSVRSATGEDHHLAHPDDLVAAVIADCSAGLLNRAEIAAKHGITPTTVSAWASAQWRRQGATPVAVRDGRLRPRPACGTRAAYSAHQKRGEVIDPACKQANSEYMRAYKAKRYNARWVDAA